MVARLKESDEALNQLFPALTDGTRRDILARSLTETPSVSDLAARYEMSFAAVQKHVAVLERAGLVQKRANGREQRVSTNRARRQRAGELLDYFESLWRQRMAQLDDSSSAKRKMTMPLTSVTKDAATLTLTVVGDYPLPQQRLWDVFADPRQLERFWGPPVWPATFTRHDMKVGGRAEYFLTRPKGEKWSGSWKFTAVNPISFFEAHDGEDNAVDENMPSSMKFIVETTPTGSRMTGSV